MPPSPHVYDVTEADFQERVVDPSMERPVLVDFWSPSCQPCLMLGPVLERLVAERQGKVLLAKVNVDECPQLAEYFQVSGIPDVKIISEARVIHEFQGAQPESALRQLLDQLTGANDPLAKARELEEGSPAEAEAIYRGLIEKDGDNLAARVGLARVLLALDRPEEIEALLDPVGREGELGVEAERLKAMMKLQHTQGGDEAALRKKIAAEPKNAQARLDLGTLLAGHARYPEALAMLLAAGELDFNLAGGKVREVMVQIFNALGPNHPLSNEYRSKLSQLLY